MKQYIIYFSTSIFLFFAPMRGLMIAVGMAIVLDTFFCIYRSTKDVDYMFNIHGRALSILYKIMLYELGILCVYMMDFYLFSDLTVKMFSIEFMSTKIFAIVLIFVEGASIKDNFEKATGQNVVALIKKALGGIKEMKDGVTDIIEK
jgi:hypothetical protein